MRSRMSALVEKMMGGSAAGRAFIAPITEEVKEGAMAGKTILDGMAIYIPQDKRLHPSPNLYTHRGT